MIQVIKRCEFPMADGFKCNQPYRVSSASAGGRKFCDTHLGNKRRDQETESEHGLVKSTNIHAQAGNNMQMREWVMHQMKQEKKNEDRLDRMERAIERLDEMVSTLKTSSKDSKQIKAIVKQELGIPKHMSSDDYLISKTEIVVVKYLQKIKAEIREIKNKLNDDSNSTEEE